MEKGSRREGKTVWEIAEMYSNAYFGDLTQLNVPLEEYTFPRATDNIKEQIELVQQLEEKGYTYRISDGIYFDTSKHTAYADFARLNMEGLKSGARVEENTEKKNITDFALWKFSPKNEQRQMEWDSPWGVGFPGWHIECSAMAMKYLGHHFDIHTGGIEHIQVHHTNEIAQSECATGEKYANYWMHNNHLLDPSGKMSKSSGDFLTVDSVVTKGFQPLAFRYFLLTAHYRKELGFSFEALQGASIAYKKLLEFCIASEGVLGVVNKTYQGEFLSAVSHDLGTPEGIAIMWRMIKDENLSKEDKYSTLLEMDKVLGLSLSESRKVKVAIPQEVQILLDKRVEARKDKNFTESDRLRDEIRKLGYIVKDSPDGQEVVKI
jgi:cysteinyl-tRNA synthetase